MASKDNEFVVTLSKFNEGQAPLTHFDSLTELGNAGQYSVATNIDIISKPGILTQGPGLANLTNGTQAGVVTELINFIMDKAVAADVAFGIGATKLFKISSTTVATGGTPSWPQAITLCTDGSSLIDLKGNIYGFYNKSSGGDIMKMPISTEEIDPDWGSTTPTGYAALQSAIHPVASKEDLMCFGNERYLGTFNDTTNTLAPTKLDFGTGSVVADVAFHANQWWIGVNAGVTGTNRTTSQIYLYDGAASASILADETAVGVQRIGFLYPMNGIVYVAYQDLSSAGFKIGYISGRQLKYLRSFTGSLPTFAQKSLYKDTIIFLSSGLVWSCGAVIEQLPVQISQLADGGHATCGAIAAPFGTPMIASTESTNYKLAKFSGYDTACSWKAIVIPVMNGRMLGYIDEVIVSTKSLGAGASCALTIEANQAMDTSSTQTIATTGKRRHVFSSFALTAIEDFRIVLSWAGGSATNDCGIRKIRVTGHWVEK